MLASPTMFRLRRIVRPFEFIRPVLHSIRRSFVRPLEFIRPVREANMRKNKVNNEQRKVEHSKEQCEANKVNNEHANGRTGEPH